MPTTYFDPTMKAAYLQSRTNAAGAATTDVDGEEMRLFHSLLSAGVFAANDYKVAPGAGLSVAVGSGSPRHDVAVIQGTADGQGRYLVRLEATTTVALPAADLTNPRIDEIYVVVVDHAFDAGGITKARLALRTGTAAASPVAPGPDPAWKAALKLATVNVATGATSVTAGQITDARAVSKILAGIDATSIAGGVYTKAEVDALLAGKAALAHAHAEADLPNASTTAQGVVQLTDSTASTSTTTAATANAAKKAYDRGTTGITDAAAASTRAGSRLIAWTGTDSQVIVSTGAPSGGQNGDIWLRV
jgi:Phage tail fibre repeat